MVSNGNIPLTLLRPVDSVHYASPGCAVAWHGFAHDPAFGTPLNVHNEADSAYRSLAWQQYRWNLHASNPRLYPVAAVPGHSNHGLGQAIDIGNYYLYSHALLVRIGKKYNFKFDTPSEAWHVVYQGAPNYSTTASTGTTTLISNATETDDDMAIRTYTLDKGKSYRIMGEGWDKPLLDPKTLKPCTSGQVGTINKWLAYDPAFFPNGRLGAAVIDAPNRDLIKAALTPANG